MNLLVSRIKYVLLVLLTILLYFVQPNIIYAQESGSDIILAVSERTASVRDAIVAAVAGVTDAAHVTEEHLTSIATLNLRRKEITSLKSGDFSGLTNLTSLNLYGNMLSSLPDRMFAGLTALTTLRLGGNTVDPLLAPVTLEKVESGQFRAFIPCAAPFSITLPISVTNGNTSSNVTITKGSSRSETITVTRTEGTTAAVSLNIGTLPGLPRNHYGYALSKSDVLPLEIIAEITSVPIIEQETEAETETETETETPQVPTTPEVPIEEKNKAPTFNDGMMTLRFIKISDLHLAKIMSLNLNNKSIKTLRGDDFNGLLSLTTLDLRNNQLTELPDGIFAELPSLVTLQLEQDTVDPLCKRRKLC